MAEKNSIIKGIAYYAEAVRTLVLTGNLIPGTTLLPVREPNNSSDQNAIALYGVGRKQLGYIARDIAAILAPRIDLGEKINVYVTEVVGDGLTSPIDVKIRIETKKPIWVYREGSGQGIPSFPMEFQDKKTSARTTAKKTTSDADGLIGQLFKTENGDVLEVIQTLQEYIRVKDKHGHTFLRKRREIGHELTPVSSTPAHIEDSRIPEEDTLVDIRKAKQCGKKQGVVFSASCAPNVLLEGAKSGDPDAMYWLASCMYYGENGFSIDDEEARKWLQKAVDLGHVQARKDFSAWFRTPAELHEMYADQL